MVMSPDSMVQLRQQMQTLKSRLILMSNLVDESNADTLRPLFAAQDEMIMGRLMILTKDADEYLKDMQQKLNDAWSGKF